MAKKIGLIAGPDDDPLVQEFLPRCAAQPDIEARLFTVGHLIERHINSCDVLIDRLSHRVTHFRLYLKTAALSGARVIPDPFWSSADDKFFSLVLAARIGLTVPRACLLPQKHPPFVDRSRDLRNLAYPFGWKEAVEYVRFPALLRRMDYIGAYGDRTVVRSWDEFWAAYDASGAQVTALQQWHDSELYIRAFCVGEEVVLVHHDADRHCGIPHDDDSWLGTALARVVRQHAREISRALGYEINCVEMVVQDGSPVAIDVSNPYVELRLDQIPHESFVAIVDALVALAVTRARDTRTLTVDRYRFAERLGGG